MRAALALAVALLGCGSEPEPEDGDSLIYAAAMTAWEAQVEATDLPPVDTRWDRPYCANLHMFDVVQPQTLEAYVLAGCPEKSWACTLYRRVPGHLVPHYYPVAYINPQLQLSRVLAAAGHEILHPLARCAGLGYDLTHSNPLIWEGRMRVSVESILESYLYEEYIRAGPLI